MAKILVVEDSPYQQQLIKESFRASSPSDTVLFASSAEEAEKILEENPDIDLLFVDYLLEGQNGVAFTRHLMAEGYEVPVVVMTAYGSAELVVEAMKAGAYDYIVKDKDYHLILPEVAKKTLDAYRASKESLHLYNLLLEFSDLLVETSSYIRQMNAMVDLGPTLQMFLRAAMGISKADSGVLFVSQTHGELRLYTDKIEVKEDDIEPLTEVKEPIHGVLRDSDLLKIKGAEGWSYSYYPLRFGVSASGGLLLLFRSGEKMSLSRHTVVELFVDTATASVMASLLFERVAESNRLWQATIDSICDPIVLVDSEGRILRCNRPFADMINIPIKECEGLRIEDLEGVEIEIFREVLKKGQHGSEEIMKGGRVYLVDVYTVSVKNEEVKTIILKDTTEHHRMKEQFYFTDKLTSLGRMIGGVAHEINNPLTGIMGYTELLMRRINDPEHQRMLNNIYTSAERCRKIVESLQQFASQKPVQYRSVNLNDLLESTILLREHWLKNAQIEVRRNYADLPFIEADPQQLQQVFLDMILNSEYALQHSGKKERYIELRTYYNPEEEVVIAEVTDNGTGIPEEELPKIFDPFFTTKEVNEGTGLGLSIAYSIVKDHGGSIEVESTPGEGTTFRVRLPRRR